jgi:hypothetical protein
MATITISDEVRDRFANNTVKAKGVKRGNLKDEAELALTMYSEWIEARAEGKAGIQKWAAKWSDVKL